MKYPALSDPDFKDLYGQSIYLSTENYRIIYLSPQDFRIVKVKKSAKWYKTHRLMFTSFEHRAISETSKLIPFTFAKFEEKYFDKPKDDQDIFASIASKAAALRKDTKFNTATILEALLTSLKKFTNKEK